MNLLGHDHLVCYYQVVRLSRCSWKLWSSQDQQLLRFVQILEVERLSSWPTRLENVFSELTKFVYLAEVDAFLYPS